MCSAGSSAVPVAIHRPLRSPNVAVCQTRVADFILPTPGVLRAAGPTANHDNVNHTGLPLQDRLELFHNKRITCSTINTTD